MKINAIALAAVMFGAVLPAAAQAQDKAADQANTYQVSQSVAFRDLDLTNEQGRARLDQRISSAVRQVCGSMNSRDLRQVAQVRSCRRAAASFAANGRELAMAASTRRADVALLSDSTSLPGK